MPLSNTRQLLFALCLLGFSHLSAQQINGPKEDTQQILKLIQQFSEAVMASDYDAIANAYTTDGKIFPNNADIITGRADRRERDHPEWGSEAEDQFGSGCIQ